MISLSTAKFSNISSESFGDDTNFCRFPGVGGFRIARCHGVDWGIFVNTLRGDELP